MVGRRTTAAAGESDAQTLRRISSSSACAAWSAPTPRGQALNAPLLSSHRGVRGRLHGSSARTRSSTGCPQPVLTWSRAGLGGPECSGAAGGGCPAGSGVVGGRGRGVVAQVESAAGAGAGASGGGGVGQQGGLGPAGDGVRAAQPRAGGHPAPGRGRLGRRVDCGRAGGGFDRAGSRAAAPATGPRPRDGPTGCDRARADQAGVVAPVLSDEDEAPPARGRNRRPNPVTEAGLGAVHGGAGDPRGAAGRPPG